MSKLDVVVIQSRCPGMVSGFFTTQAKVTYFMWQNNKLTLQVKGTGEFTVQIPTELLDLINENKFDTRVQSLEKEGK